MPAGLGRAIQNVDSERGDKEPDQEEFATIFDPAQAAQDAERRKALWRSQLLAIAVTNARVLGLRRLRGS